MFRPRVLIVESDAVLRDGCAALLAEEGWTVVTAADPAAAEPLLLSEAPFDLAAIETDGAGALPLRLAGWIVGRSGSGAAAVLLVPPDAPADVDWIEDASLKVVRRPPCARALRNYLVFQAARLAEFRAYRREREEERTRYADLPFPYRLGLRARDALAAMHRDRTLYALLVAFVTAQLIIRAFILMDGLGEAPAGSYRGPVAGRGETSELVRVLEEWKTQDLAR